MKKPFPIDALMLAHQMAVLRWERRQRRYQFVKKNAARILKLSTESWPRMARGMNPDYVKWMEIVYKVKSLGLYGLGTSPCDIIIQLKHMAEEIKRQKK